MVYRILKIWAQLAFRLYFRRIYISGIENIPADGALLILVNHPNSFLEPCIIAAFQHRNLHFLVRGDMFEKKWLLPILKATNQIPIYRLKDGFGKLRNNKNTFDQAYKVLAQQHTMMMFPEASSEMVKYLRPLQKGAARLAIGAIEQGNVDELRIVPAGIHYFNATQSRNDVILKFGKTISMKDWYNNNSFIEDKVTALTAYLQDEMNEVVISIEHQKQEKIYNEIYQIAENDELQYKNAGLIQNEDGYSFMKKIFTHLNELSEIKISEIGALLNSYSTDTTHLKSFDLSVKSGVIEKIKLLIYSILFFVPGLIGFIAYSPSLIFSKAFVSNKIKHITFYAPVRIAINMGAHLLNSLIVILILNQFFTGTQTILIFVFLQISLFSFALFIDFSRYSKYLFNRSISNHKNSLLQIRSTIMESLNK